MAALTAETQLNSKVLLRYEHTTDIAQLKVCLQLPDLEYVDVSAQLELKGALQRWPLLAAVSEVAQHEERVFPLERREAK